MRVRFWGTRGSVPSPGPSTVRYGGNTSCVEVRTDSEQLLVVDCGTGVRALGQHLVAAGTVPSGSILISHTHWDHIHGMPFFAPLFVEGAKWAVYGPRGLEQSLDRVLAGQMEYEYFPVQLDEAAAVVTFHDLVEGSFELGDATITTRYLNHPALTLGYRIEADGGVVVYASDHEQHTGSHAEHVEFLRDADLVVHDAQYESANYGPKIGWGHSTMEYVVDTAIEAGVGTVALYHHDPNRDDAGVDDLLARARARAGDRLRVIAAAEGVTVDVVGRHARPVRSVSSATRIPAVFGTVPRIVIGVEDPAVGATIRAAAALEGFEVVDPDSSIPGDRIVVGHDDWLTRPCSIAYVRTRLRAAVLRRAPRWLAAPIPENETERVAALHRLGVLDTDPEARFDRLAEMARSVLDTSIALITLIDKERQWFKAHIGFDATESHRDESFCAHAILGDDVMQVPDALEDDRFADNPAVTGDAHIRFYAGAPLTLSDGSRVGTLCVADTRPRMLSEAQVLELRELADLVVAELEVAS